MTPSPRSADCTSARRSDADEPEPGFLWLFGAATLGLFVWRRSRELRKGA